MINRQRTWTPSAGRSSCFFFFFLRSSDNLRFAFRALKVASQAFTWKISICSAKINHVFRCSLSGELATGRARLRTAIQGAASELQLTELKEQRGLRAQARKSELKSLSGPAILLDMSLTHTLYLSIHYRIKTNLKPFLSFSHSPHQRFALTGTDQTKTRHSKENYCTHKDWSQGVKPCTNNIYTLGGNYLCCKAW